MGETAVITRTRERVAVKTPRIWAEFNLPIQPNKKGKGQEMTGDELLRIVERGEKEYKEGKTKVAASIMDLLGS